ncbi:hypothetical protein [Eupransor demetentiae]|uniref:Uncharacterized protein n=1 Tax=Eupransor demetentiae TaxID=3109584 RepID=A0ABM9N6A7_9LACO|nr:hypothetical protein R54876_GBNLAHCA_01323 [Lactobacillaceae bacterium LMG 33000]
MMILGLFLLMTISIYYGYAVYTAYSVFHEKSLKANNWLLYLVFPITILKYSIKAWLKTLEEVNYSGSPSKKFCLSIFSGMAYYYIALQITAAYLLALYTNKDFANAVAAKKSVVPENDLIQESNLEFNPADYVRVAQDFLKGKKFHLA